MLNTFPRHNVAPFFSMTKQVSDAIVKRHSRLDTKESEALSVWSYIAWWLASEHWSQTWSARNARHAKIFGQLWRLRALHSRHSREEFYSSRGQTDGQTDQRGDLYSLLLRGWATLYTALCRAQDEKNQIMKSNVWLRMVSGFLMVVCEIVFAACGVVPNSHRQTRRDKIVLSRRRVGRCKLGMRRSVTGQRDRAQGWSFASRLWASCSFTEDGN